ncbi:hypothetical protein BKK81_21755 [Cupriavidus sp. USMAHM13]|uniref:response regulator transcription factor n=1 Tax=Cupriavidus sp. USMAHM13 TaxID=1389192 RepID=UPI0008A6EA03|nr:response regulator transcription factor [Cupriavidus sp. USMAHM13]AOZ01972.1 hypothetical protein BKK81_21755 [Cupriavidus sp. USMAHM13]
MTILLLAHNRLLCQTLMRRLRAVAPAGPVAPIAPVARQEPEWLLGAAAARHPEVKVDFALLDCSDARADPAVLLRALQARVAPARWLVLLPAPDVALMRLALALGAGGCIVGPAPIERVCRASDLVRAGGQCFPRALRGAGAAGTMPPHACAGTISSVCARGAPPLG